MSTKTSPTFQQLPEAATNSFINANLRAYLPIRNAPGCTRPACPVEDLCGALTGEALDDALYALADRLDRAEPDVDGAWLVMAASLSFEDAPDGADAEAEFRELCAVPVAAGRGWRTGAWLVGYAAEIAAAERMAA